MTARKNLEEAIELLLNEDEENAHVAFHNFIVKTAQSIHEAVIAEDELDDEIAEEDDSNEVEESVQDEYFGRDELTMENDDEEGMPGPDEMDDDDAEEELEMDDEDEEEEGEGVTLDADDVSDLQASLQDLQAKFDELTGGGEVEDEDDMEDEAEMDMDMDMEDDMEESLAFESEEHDEDEDELDEAVSHDAGVAAHGHAKTDAHGKHSKGESIKHNDDAKLPESAEFDFDLTEEDFEDLEEGLKTIDVKMGGEQGAGKFAGEETHTKSPVAQRDKSDVRADARSMTSKKAEHAGYDLQAKTDGAYGESQKMTPHAGDNSHDKAPALKDVAKGGGLEKQKGYGEGESGAGKFAGTETNTKSPIGSAGTRNES